MPLIIRFKQLPHLPLRIVADGQCEGCDRCALRGQSCEQIDPQQPKDCAIGHFHYEPVANNSGVTA